MTSLQPLPSFVRHNERFESVVEIIPGIHAADIFYGKTAKVPHFSIYQSSNFVILGGVRRPNGWRGRAGFWDGYVYLVPDNYDQQLKVECKSRERAIELLLKAVQTFMV